MNRVHITHLAKKRECSHLICALVIAITMKSAVNGLRRDGRREIGFGCAKHFINAVIGRQCRASKPKRGGRSGSLFQTVQKFALPRRLSFARDAIVKTRKRWHGTNDLRDSCRVLPAASRSKSYPCAWNAYRRFRRRMRGRRGSRFMARRDGKRNLGRLINCFGNPSTVQVRGRKIPGFGFWNFAGSV